MKISLLSLLFAPANIGLAALIRRDPSAAPNTNTLEVREDDNWIALFDTKSECLSLQEILDKLYLNKDDKTTVTFVYDTPAIRGFAAKLTQKQKDILASLPCIIQQGPNSALSSS